MKLVISSGFLGYKRLFLLKAKGLQCKFYDSLDNVVLYKGYNFIIVPFSYGSKSLVESYKFLNKIIVISIKSFRKLKFNSKKLKIVPLFTKEEDIDYIKKVNICKNYIESGDIYQINLSRVFEFKIEGDPFSLFLKYFNAQKVPFAYYFERDDLILINGSMELFIKKKHKKIVSEPIKGSSKSKKYLERSSKEKAELLMITDIMRNDLYKAFTKDIKVKFFKIKKFKTIYHSFSEITGKNTNSLNFLIESTFPPASVVGAPKKKAFELINKLESHDRKYYCGISILSKGKNFISAVNIRHAIIQDNKVRYFSGAGIVYDSDPLLENMETYLKLKAFYNGLV